MPSGSPVLVVGATGVLGGEIVHQLSRAHRPVRALVRQTADSTKRAALAALEHVELVSGDLKLPASLREACRGVDTIVTTASATGATQPGDSLESVDDQGQQALLAAARTLGVRRFVYLSFPPTPVDNPLQAAKRRMEQAIRTSGLEYVILQPTYFADVWFSPALGWDPLHGRVRVLGDGTGKTSWIAVHDVARFVLAACKQDARVNLTLELGGPEAVSQNEVLEMFRELGAPPFEVETVSETVLETMRANAKSSLEETFAAIMLTIARGQAIDTSKQLEFLPGNLETVQEQVRRACEARPA